MGNDRQPGRPKKPIFSIIAAIFLWSAVLGCLWLLWQRHEAAREAEASQLQKLESLRAERDSLKGLLDLSPCDAKARMAREEAAASPVAAAAASDEVERGCVFIVSSPGAQKLSTGSGFFVAPGYVVTNKHVVDKARGKILVTSKALGKPALARLVATSSQKDGNDYAILAVDVPGDAANSILRFAPEAKKTEKVGAWGFPDLVGKNDPNYARLLRGDLSSVPEMSYTEGVVSAILDREPRVIVHTAPISPGNSGGPLVNAKGEVVGINTMITLDEDSYRQASIALSASDLEKFLRGHGVEPSFAK